MRGRIFRYDPEMVLVTTRRARSVPPSLVDVQYDFGLGSASRKAQRISDFISDDHDSIRMASRRQDAALMRDITNRMEAGHLGRPLQVRSRTVRARSPPARTSSVTQESSRYRRASSVPPSFSDADYYDFDLRYQPLSYARTHFEEPTYYHTPITRYVSRGVRAGSEPPEIRRSSKQSLYATASADLAVRQARASLGRLERELGTGWDDPYYGTNRYLDYPAIRPYRAAYMTSIYDEPAEPILPYSYTPRSYHYPRSRTYEYDYPEYTPTTYYGLRSRAAEARDKLDRHKVMLDRYLPIHMGPESDVGMPSLQRSRATTSSSSTTTSKEYTAPKVVPSYRPVSKPQPKTTEKSSPPARQRPPPRPTMSDARKRAREVLCKTKKDPSYFNY